MARPAPGVVTPVAQRDRFALDPFDAGFLADSFLADAVFDADFADFFADFFADAGSDA